MTVALGIDLVQVYRLLLAAVLFTPLLELAGQSTFLPFCLLDRNTFLPPTVNLRVLNPDVLVRFLRDTQNIAYTSDCCYHV